MRIIGTVAGVVQTVVSVVQRPVSAKPMNRQNVMSR